ncbi:MAG: condensation domain-containing protein, partial [Stackebrandtia sp.]
MSESPASKPAAGGRGVPLSPAQQAALLPERLRGRQAANLSLALEITGELDPAAIERAATALVERHEILRTVYPDDRRIPYQRVAEAPDAALEVIDLADSDGLATVLAEDAAYRFDLVAELPIRLRWYRLPERAVLSIAVHPIAADDRTIELIATELLGSVADASVAQYRGYAMAQVKTLVGNAADYSELTYWVDHLTGLPERADIAAGSEAGGLASTRRTVRVSAGALGAAGADAEAVVVAALAVVLAEAGLGHDVPIGVVDPARDTIGDTGLGAYANYLVLRVDTESAATPRERIAAATNLAAEARAHATTRIERITHQLRGTAAVADGVPFQALVHVRPE